MEVDDVEVEVRMSGHGWCSIDVPGENVCKLSPYYTRRNAKNQ